MKRYMLVTAAFLLLGTVLAGCADQAKSKEQTAAAADKSENSDSDIVDLTGLTSIMVYSEVYNMMMQPAEYINKTIIMNGTYYAQYSEETERYYYFVVNEDATACCQQGVEFIWNGEHEYPEEGADIVVSGVFQSYDEDGETYYYIDADEIKM